MSLIAQLQKLALSKMKTLPFNLILFFLVSSCISVTAQSLKVVYHRTSATDMSELSPELSKLSQRKVTHIYSLTIFNGISRYSLDSIFIFHDQSGFKQYCPYQVIYKDYNKKLWLEESARYKEGYLYEQNLDQMREGNARWQWTITDEQKIIAGILCTKAVAREEHIAWFASDIPYLDGPFYGVFNLPGLVLSYENRVGKWTALSVHFGAKPIILPTGQRFNKKSAIDLPYNEWMALGKDKVIVIDSQTPQKTWLKFER
jgi:GLPGLI family protein